MIAFARKTKRAIYTLIALVLVVTVVVGCTFTGGKIQNPNDPTHTTDPTGATESTKPAESTNPTAPEKEDFLQQVDGIPLAQEELDYFTELFTHVNAEKEEDINWYNILLSCGWTIEGYMEGFAVPEDVNLKMLFNNGFGESSKLSQWTAEELAFIRGIYPGYPENWGDLYRLPKEKMGRVLQDYLGITLQQSNKVWMDKLEFYPYTDCYFVAPAGAVGELEGKIAAGKRCADGMVYLIYHRDDPYSEGFLLLRLMPNPGNEKVPYRVKTCIQIKSAKDILPFLRPALHLPTEEQYSVTHNVSGTYFLLHYRADSEINDFGYEGKPYTTAGMEENCLYAIDDGVTVPISGAPVSAWARDWENSCVYFVKEKEARKIWRTDLHGQNPTVVYESQYGDITFLSCTGGWLSIIENDNRAALFDTNTGKLTVLLNAYRIEQFSYDAKEMRVFWEGKLNESDPEKPGDWYIGDYRYYYYLKTGLHQVLDGNGNWVTVTPEQ